VQTVTSNKQSGRHDCKTIELGDALKDGSISFGQAQAFTKQSRNEPLRLFIEHEAEFLETAKTTECSA
jgi:hypothetical protein